MAQLIIRLDGDGAMADLMPPGTDSPEKIQALLDSGEYVHLSNDAEIVVSGLVGGMQSGAPSVCLGFKLPDGKVVLAETSWRLFATAFHALAGKFGTAYPDLQDMELIHDGPPGAGKMKYQIVSDDALQTMQCEVCGARTTFPPQSEGTEPLEAMRWLYRHFRAKHPGWPPPYEPPAGEDWDADE